MQSINRSRFFHPSMCCTCKAITNLMKCGKCKSVSYCSKEHQVQDWRNHKEICKHIAAIDKIFTVQMQNIIANRRVYLSMVGDKLSQKLKRNLYPYELDIVEFRQYCVVCNAKNCINCCEVCLSVFYCSAEHQNSHAEMHRKFCSSLKLNLDIIMNVFKCTLYMPRFTGKLLQDSIIQLPENLKCLVELLTQETYLVFEMNFLSNFVVTDVMSYMGSIIFALEKANLIKNRLFFKKKLVVHVVRPRDRLIEEFNYFLLEFFYHWMKNLEELTVIIIEPNGRILNPVAINMTCRFCKMNYTNSKILLITDYYHDVIDNLGKPDVVVTFNCEKFLCSTWIKDIPSLIKHAGVPLIVTDFTMENMKKDLKTFQNVTSKKFEVILPPQKNPFSCISPERNGIDKDYPIYFSNRYIMVLSCNQE